jgi:hypothetical protein
MSIGSILIASGCFSEISSILTPPEALAKNTGPWYFLSNVIEKYFSFTTSIVSNIIIHTYFFH